MSDTRAKQLQLLTPELRSYGRRRGRKLSARQAAYIRTMLPAVRVDLAGAPPSDATSLFTEPRIVMAPHEHVGEPGRTTCPECLQQWTRPVREVWLEIGFGGGEHLVWQAQNTPEVGLVGCEVFEDGVVKLVTAIDDKALRNVLVCVEDARALLRWLPPASIARAFVLFPDPWPKRKHVKRRLVSRRTLDLLARVMKPDAELRLATDIGDYAHTMLLALTGHPAFAWEAAGPEDWRRRPPDWPPTRYEAKALKEGRRPYYFRFRRR